MRKENGERNERTSKSWTISPKSRVAKLPAVFLDKELSCVFADANSLDFTLKSSSTFATLLKPFHRLSQRPSGRVFGLIPRECRQESLCWYAIYTKLCTRLTLVFSGSRLNYMSPNLLRRARHK
jgi:hypothetical protein